MANNSKNDATLATLAVDSGTLTPEFNPNTTAYAVELTAGTTKVPTLTATATDTNAKVDITNADALPGKSAIAVTAADGTTTATYEVVFTIADADAYSTLANKLIADNNLTSVYRTADGFWFSDKEAAEQHRQQIGGKIKIYEKTK